MYPLSGIINEIKYYTKLERQKKLTKNTYKKITFIVIIFFLISIQTA